MPRRPFDPDRMFAAEDPAPDSPPVPAELSVSQLAGMIKTTLEKQLPASLRVIGEVSNLSTRNHWYFSLKDDSSVVSCVAWASAARGFGFTPSDGDEIVVKGHVGHYTPQGRTQFYVTGMTPVGAGALQLQYEQRCRELRELGYFDEANKKPLPAFPLRIAVLSSSGGAAIHDVIDTARQRCPAVRLLLVDVRVQGDGSAASVAAAIARVDREREALELDAIIVTRGGGSIEDLWAFNERVVADAIHACHLPIVAAIGHESDTTIAELVADRRAATPTQAAMLLVPSAEELTQQITHLTERLTAVCGRRLDHARQRIDAVGRHVFLRDPRRLLDRPRERVDRLARDLQRTHREHLSRRRLATERLAGRLASIRPDDLFARRRQRLALLQERLRAVSLAQLARSRSRIDASAGAIQALDPRGVLQRGFTWTTDEDGILLRGAADLQPGQVIRTHFADGTVDSRVVDPSSEAAKKPPRRRGMRRDQTSPPDRDQLDLFGRGQ